jgi:hypothetical protein
MTEAQWTAMSLEARRIRLAAYVDYASDTCADVARRTWVDLPYWLQRAFMYFEEAE